MWAILNPDIGAYVCGFDWTGEAEFSWDEFVALKFNTEAEVKECARSNVIHGVAIVEILPKPKNEKEK